MNSLSKGLAALTVVALAAGGASAQSGPEYFNGKTVDYIVATTAGGGYDTYGRLVAEFMQRHLPGSTFVVRNMPGAGNLIGANYIAAAAPDGLTLGTFNPGLVYRQLTGHEGMHFDMAELSWIGKAASDSRVIVVSEQSGIETWEDLVNLEQPIRFSTASVGTSSMAESLMLLNVLDLNVQTIHGYTGNEDEMAMMRGEIQGLIASRSSLEPFVEAGNGRFIAQVAGEPSDLPMLADLVPGNEDLLEVVALVESQDVLNRFTVGPPGIPEDILQTLRDAFDAATSDPEFLERADRLGLPISPLGGAEVAEAVVRALDQDEDLIEFLRQTLTD